MASEAAKELARKQKEELKAAKLAKKNSTNPKDWGWFKQLRETRKATKEMDPKLDLWMLGGFFGVLLVLTALGWLVFTPTWWLWMALGVMGGLVAAMYMLIFRSKRATYKKYEGQPGSAEVAFNMLKKKKYAYATAIAFNKQLDVVHRVVGPAGILLVGEGTGARLKALMAAEQRKHEQVAYGVSVRQVVIGNGAGQVPLNKLEKYIKKLGKGEPDFKKLTKGQLREVKARLKALDAMRSNLPLPKGPMPQSKSVGRALRGR
ncbi:MAG: DUF4191 domain-containing protein [Propionibacteriaceae bacterium]|jgi:hypothetical protein|nr:DUF4191 domain-containing protein [Propionibacteriaceae bacterium]